MADKMSQICTGPLTMKVFSDGNAIPDEALVYAISVKKGINKISTASIQIFDGGASEEDSFPISSGGSFNPGKEIEIKAGYASQEETIYKGIVIRHGMKVTASGKFTLNIECKDQAVKLTVGRNNGYFAEKKDSDIIQEILSAYSDLDASVDASSYVNPEIIQNYSSNWDFILQRAEMNGFLLYNSDNSLRIAAPSVSTPVLDILPGDGLISFNAYMDARNQVATINSASWDRENLEVVQEESSSTPGDIGGNISPSDLAGVLGVEAYNLQTTGSLPSEVLQAWVSAKHQKNAFSKIQGNITIEGYPKLQLGDTVNLEGFSDQFNGSQYVGGFEHVIEQGSFKTTIQLGISAEFFSDENRDIAAPSASGIISPIKGLHIGVVEQIHEDENGEFRIKVQLPTLQVDNMSVWARMTQFYATAEAGLFFYPEVNDEVIVGFLNEDPQAPVVLGSVYNKSNAIPPYEPAEENYIKAIVTKTGLKVEFNEENNAITLITPEEQSILIDDTEKMITVKDMNDNVIELTDAGISISTAGDIIFDAQGNIELNAQGNVAVAATGDFTGEGMNVALTGQTKFAAEGAMTEVKGSGQTTIEGGIVMIN